MDRIYTLFTITAFSIGGRLNFHHSPFPFFDWGHSPTFLSAHILYLYRQAGVWIFALLHARLREQPVPGGTGEETRRYLVHNASKRMEMESLKIDGWLSTTPVLVHPEIRFEVV
jgi:hypothetical protein